MNFLKNVKHDKRKTNKFTKFYQTFQTRPEQNKVTTYKLFDQKFQTHQGQQIKTFNTLKNHVRDPGVHNTFEIKQIIDLFWYF